ncbi:hypothetical protein [Mesobacillus foraminis]|uniref:hypothetical protein n=1 Tax=Mesobacillus foraminis TaxID=279826 RepID=UPI0013CEE2AB|nr:hypothetical protein [Mesobacillus foraminis]
MVSSQGRFALYTEQTEEGFVDWHLDNYTFDYKTNKVLIRVMENYEYENGEPVTPLSVLYLNFEEVDGTWVITEVWYDV